MLSLSRTGTPSKGPSALPALRRWSEAVVVLSAAAFGEPAREDEALGHDVYTYFLLEALTVDDHLRRLVENIAHLVYRKRFFLDYRSHHDARGGGADRSGELDFDVVHQLCVGDQTRIGPVKAFGA